MDDNTRISSAVRAHLESYWPDRPHADFVWTLGPIGETLPRFRVLRIAPLDRTTTWVYATIGAWEATAEEEHGTEFLVLSRHEDPRHVELLAMVANLHADARYRLRQGSVIEIGRPWTDGSEADHLLVSLPYPFGPALERCELDDRHVQFLWLVPITQAEARLGRTDGVEALERLLERSGVDVTHPARQSLA